MIKATALALCLLAIGTSAAHANAAWTQCNSNSDCVRIYGTCGDRAVNKSHADEAQYNYSQQAALVTCRMPGDTQRNSTAHRVPMCVENTCVMKQPVQRR